MTLIALALLALSVQAPQDTLPTAPGAYADSATRAVVEAARQARNSNERLITGYRARVSQRLGMGLRAAGRDRMLYRQELVADITWRRDSVSTITAVGAREGVPIAIKGDQVPEDLNSELTDLVIDPASDNIDLIGMGGDHALVYPLSDSGAVLYRFSLGGTTVIGLPGGRSVRLVAVEVRAREPSFRLVNGTIWLDADSHNLVRAVVRPSRPFDMRRDIDGKDLDGVPGFFNVHARVRYITIEYGYYENRWWLPRLVAIDAVANVGSLLDTPFRLERSYTDYRVTGGTPPDPESTFRPAGSDRVPDSPTNLAAQRERKDSIDALVTACIDSIVSDRGSARAVKQRCRRMVRSATTNLSVIVPDDTLQLLNDAALGEPILQMGDIVDRDELKQLADAIDALPGRPWESTVKLPASASALLSHARYNRVEGLSLGATAGVDFGKLQLNGLGRIGLADGVPRGELTLQRLSGDTRLALTGYRRLVATNPANRPLGAVNSTMSLLAGRDDGDYYRSRGVELTAGDIASGWWSGRVWAERQQSAEVEATASLPRLWGSDNRFRPNFSADKASQYGASLTLRGNRVVSPAFTFGGEMNLEQHGGDFGFARGSVSLSTWFTPAGPVAAAVTIAAGTSRGDVPTQGNYFLGGVGTLRGYAGGVIAGESFWRARLEVGTSLPAARLVAFGDAGWAGPRDRFSSGQPRIGAGVGASFLDGLFRIDLARALREPTGWRLELELGGLM